MKRDVGEEEDGSSGVLVGGSMCMASLSVESVEVSGGVGSRVGFRDFFERLEFPFHVASRSELKFWLTKHVRSLMSLTKWVS